MKMEDRLDFLKKIEMFQDLDESAFSIIGANLIEVELNSGEFLFHKGDKGDSLYIVCEGILEARDGDFVIRTFKKGFVLGEFVLLGNHLRSASMVAKTDCFLLKLTDNFFFDYLMKDVTVLQNILKSLVNRILQEEQKNQKLLHAILPKDIADELKEKGFSEPEHYEKVSVIFTDFKGFTKIAENMTPQELLKELDACFSQFDKITERFNLEKLKTIGDSYMCAGGIPKVNATNPIDTCLAALEIQSLMNQMKGLKKELNVPYWELRLGIHTGPVMAGVVGEKKFAYDIWGDTVNTASRMESSGTAGRINISYATYELVKNFFECEYRGEIDAKNKGKVKMYYLNRIKPEFAKDDAGMIPTDNFWKRIHNSYE